MMRRGRCVGVCLGSNLSVVEDILFSDGGVSPFQRVDSSPHGTPSIIDGLGDIIGLGSEGRALKSSVGDMSM